MTQAFYAHMNNKTIKKKPAIMVKLVKASKNQGISKKMALLQKEVEVN
jgi:hypothetical protein